MFVISIRYIYSPIFMYFPFAYNYFRFFLSVLSCFTACFTFSTYLNSLNQSEIYLVFFINLAQHYGSPQTIAVLCGSNTEIVW